ncbi:hypothetical protein DY000_02012690 [Brassica cretica]|uniref:Uncharacterized protein n=1 Tax=Brassica cretica TaxID=69181 RepID=A0ABQ7D8A1_BRACR|nr:hypothetical protein DY000_02012690 [Brassica cretica]
MFVANFQSSSLPLHHHLGLVKDVANACCVADKVSHGGRRGREARQIIGLVKDVANACCVADKYTRDIYIIASSGKAVPAISSVRQEL